MLNSRNFQSPDYSPYSPPWQKLLWVKQNYPDNYVDNTFLDELQRNVNVQSYDYWTMVGESGVISQQLSSVGIFIAIFIYLQNSVMSGHHLIWAGSLSTGIGYVFWDLIMVKTREFKRNKNKRLRQVQLMFFLGQRVAKSAFFFFITLLGLSPILKTLTSQISHDTLWALTVICFLINVLFHDYSTQTSTIKITGSLSTNAAIFASVLLASRLKTNTGVFGLLSFAVEWFSLFPIFRRCLKDLNAKVQIMLTIVMLIVCVLLFLPISKAVVCIHILGFLFLTFVGPYWLIFIQKYKNEIHGPWDEARPRLQRPRRNIYRKKKVQ